MDNDRINLAIHQVSEGRMLVNNGKRALKQELIKDSFKCRTTRYSLDELERRLPSLSPSARLDLAVAYILHGSDYATVQRILADANDC